VERVPPYWIDAGVLIQCDAGPYNHAMVQKFWAFIDGELKKGTIRMPRRAWREVTDGNDWVAKWCRDRRDKGLCIPPSKIVQAKNTLVANYVQTEHKISGHRKARQHQIAMFLKGADPWLIAHALVTGTVVTHEDREKPQEWKIKIPNVAKEMGARWRDTYTMLHELDMRL
jgi:hypothetical protein